MKLFTWETVKKDAVSDKIWRKAIFGEKLTLAQFSLAKGAVVPPHHHESEQATYVVEGALKFELDGEEVVVREGEVLLIPSNTPHGALALGDTFVLEVFSPIRMDWLST